MQIRVFAREIEVDCSEFENKISNLGLDTFNAKKKESMVCYIVWKTCIT